MPNQDNPSGHDGDSDQGANPKPDGIPGGIKRQPNDAGPNDGEQTLHTHSKPSLRIRLWHALWRKRIFRHTKADRPNVNWAEKVMACVTIAILAVGAIQAYIYWNQSELMKLSLYQTQQTIALNMGQVAIAGRNAKTAEDTLSEIQEGGNDTHEIAVQAKNQAARTKEVGQQALRAMLVEQRPWLFIPLGSEHFPPPVVGGDVADELKVVNTGRTLARNVIVTFCLRVLNKGEEPDFSYSNHFFPPIMAKMGTVFPTEAPRDLRVPAVTMRNGKKVTVHAQQKDIDGLTNGDYYVVVFGIITYDDDFLRKHWTKYCRAILYSQPLAKAPSQTCTDYNDADHNN